MRTTPSRTTAARLTAAVVALGLLAGSACSSDDDGTAAPGDTAPNGTEPAPDALPADDAPDRRDTPPGDPPQTVTREDVERAVEQLPMEADALLEESGVPGMAVAVVFEDEVVFSGGFGVREVGGDEPVSAETLFQIASLSKPVGATTVSRLVDQGVVSWDDPVTTYLPDFAIGDGWTSEHVTIADLYAHRSGLPGHAGDLLEDLGYDREEVLARLALQPLGPFRDQYAYTNFGLTAAAEAAATAADAPWEEVNRTELYEPAGMDATTSVLDEYLAAENRAVPHRLQGDGTFAPDAQRDPTAQDPAGGVASTADDMARFLRLHLADGELDGEQLIDPDALVPMRSPQITSGPGRTPSARASFYGLGLGWGVDDEGYVQWSHSGAFVLGAATNLVMVPGQRLGVVALTNGTPVGAPEAMNQIILDLVLHGEVTKDWYQLYNGRFQQMVEYDLPTDWSVEIPNPTRPRAADAYVGTYANDYYGPLEVREEGDELVMVLGPRGDTFQLTPYEGDAFLFTPPGENSLGPTGIVFEVGDDGVAGSVTSEFYDESGLGTWTREG